MNVSQDKPSIRFVGQADFASEVLQSGKPVLAVFTAPYPPMKHNPCSVELLMRPRLARSAGEEPGKKSPAGTLTRPQRGRKP